MKYFLIAGEASGDLHASQLIAALRERDTEAQFQFLGGDMMAAAAGVEPLMHYRDMAYMGFVEVIKHLPTILGIMRRAKQAIDDMAPHVLILVDYPSFNLKLAKYAHQRGIAVHYFISPKVWAWKSWRVKDIKRWVDAMYCILPFEPAWYAQRDYAVTYVGNPTVKEVAQAREHFVPRDEFVRQLGLDASKPIVAVVPGSRVKEICENLPLMLEAVSRHSECQPVIAAAPSIDSALYERYAPGVTRVEGRTMELVAHSRVALVTSGTATLEAAVVGTPQVACYRYNGSKLTYRILRRIIHGPYVTLPNLIAEEFIIPELLFHMCTADAIDAQLNALLPDGEPRATMLKDYARMMEALGSNDCAVTTAQAIIRTLQQSP